MLRAVAGRGIDDRLLYVLLPSLVYLLLVALIPIDVLMQRHGNDLNLYFEVSRRMLDGELPYRNIPFEYPPGALAAILIPRLPIPDPTLSLGHYVMLFVAMNAAIVAGISLILVRLTKRWRPRRRVTSVLAVWLLVVLITAPIVPWRYDLLPAILSLSGVAAAVTGWPLGAGLLFGLGAATKLYPAVLLPLLLLGYVALRDRPSLMTCAAAFVAGALVPILPFLLADSSSALGFLTYFNERGIQLESFLAGLIGVASNLGLVEAEVVFASGSWQVDTPIAEALLGLGTLLLGASLLLAYVLVYRRFRHEVIATKGISASTLVGAVVAVLLLVMGFGKVFSPQYVAWILPFLPLLAMRHALVGVLICLLTVAIYPMLFADSLVGFDPVALVALNARNAAVLALALWLLLDRDRRRASITPAPPAGAAASQPATPSAGPINRAVSEGVARWRTATLFRALSGATRSRLVVPSLGVWSLATGIIVMLALTYALPMLAVFTVWPAMLVVPGWVVLRWSRVRVGVAAGLGLAIVLSVAISAHLTYWLAILLGRYDRGITIFVAGCLLLSAVPTVVVLARRKKSTVRLRAALRRGWHGLLAGAASAALVAIILGLTIWVVDDAGVTTSWVNWSDLLVHLSIAESVNAGNFPPDVPYFAGAPLTYHWFSDFHAAMLASAAGMFSAITFVVDSSVLTGALGLIVFGLAAHLVRDRRAALIAVLLVTLGGGLGVLRLGIEWMSGAGDALALLTQSGYDHRWTTEWPYFRIPSVFATGLLPHRATTVGLPILGGALLLLVAALPLSGRRLRRNPRAIAVAGATCAALAPFHFFFFPAAYLLSLLYVVAHGRLRGRLFIRDAVTFLVPFAIALPFVVEPLINLGGQGSFRFDLWWDAPSEDGPLGIAFFYITNLGVPFVLGAAAIFMPGLGRARWFLLAWVATMFAIPNLMTFTHVAFDMNKYFQAMWIAVALLAAWAVRRWPTAVLVPVLALSIVTPVQTAIYAVSSRAGVLSSGELEAADWAAVHTPPRSVFVTNGWLHSFTDVAGRLRLHTFVPYIANLGYDTAERVADVHRIYCGGSPEEAAATMRSLRADYVVETSTDETCEAPVDFAASRLFVLAFENASLRIWERVG